MTINIMGLRDQSLYLNFVLGKYGRKYKEPLWMFSGVE